MLGIAIMSTERRGTPRKDGDVAWRHHRAGEYRELASDAASSAGPSTDPDGPSTRIHVAVRAHLCSPRAEPLLES